MLVGYDKNGQKLNWGDICKFRIQDKEYEGMIDYSEDCFAYTFEMKDDKFPSVLMNVAERDSIEKIIYVWSTQPNKDDYGFYRELAKNK